MSGLVDRLFLAGMNNQMHTGMVLVDLKKAVDTLDHKVLLEENKYFGFRTSITEWFESYLSNRKFLVYVDNFFSETNIKVQCATRLYSWTTPFSIIYK